MATYTAIWQGKVKYCRPLTLDEMGNDYATQFYPNKQALDEIQALINGSPPIKNKLKQDEDGNYYIRLSCKPTKVIKGVTKEFRVVVLEADGMTAMSRPIGNGSDVTVEVEVYNYRQGEGKAIRWKQIRVDNLVEYNPESKLMETPPNMEGVPPPVWG
jgi:hypothetical protein